CFFLPVSQLSVCFPVWPTIKAGQTVALAHIIANINLKVYRTEREKSTNVRLHICAFLIYCSRDGSLIFYNYFSLYLRPLFFPSASILPNFTSSFTRILALDSFTPTTSTNSLI